MGAPFPSIIHKLSGAKMTRTPINAKSSAGFAEDELIPPPTLINLISPGDVEITLEGDASGFPLRGMLVA